MSDKKICPFCDEEIDLEECETTKVWDDEGNHILEYNCPECGEWIPYYKI